MFGGGSEIAWIVKWRIFSENIWEHLCKSRL